MPGTTDRLLRDSLFRAHRNVFLKQAIAQQTAHRAYGNTEKNKQADYLAACFSLLHPVFSIMRVRQQYVRGKIPQHFTDYLLAIRVRKCIGQIIQLKTQQVEQNEVPPPYAHAIGTQRWKNCRKNKSRTFVVKNLGLSMNDSGNHGCFALRRPPLATARRKISLMGHAKNIIHAADQPQRYGSPV